jgi:hypothetical protein
MAPSGSVHRLPIFQYGERKPEVAIVLIILRKSRIMFDSMLARVDLQTATPMFLGSRNSMTQVTLR